MIELAKGGGLWTVKLNRPEKANSLTTEMLAQMVAILEEAKSASDLRALIVTGEGEKVFSAGADLEEAKTGLTVSPLWEKVSSAIAALPCLTICALNGTLAGGAFGMALACDVRLSVPNARFFYPVAKHGFLPQPSDPGRMVDLMGPARAKWILLCGQKISAEDALAFGLIDRIVVAESLIDEAVALAADSLAGKPDVLQQIKAMCAAR